MTRVRLTSVHRFSATTVSEAVAAAPREDIWAAITDPKVLPKLTPLLPHIEAYGDLWRWDLSRINVLGMVVDPSFTERMTFVPNERIEYTHEPPAAPTSGPAPRAGTSSATTRPEPTWPC